MMLLDSMCSEVSSQCLLGPEEGVCMHKFIEMSTPFLDTYPYLVEYRLAG